MHVKRAEASVADGRRWRKSRDRAIAQTGYAVKRIDYRKNVAGSARLMTNLAQ